MCVLSTFGVSFFGKHFAMVCMPLGAACDAPSCEAILILTLLLVVDLQPISQDWLFTSHFACLCRLLCNIHQGDFCVEPSHRMTTITAACVAM